MEVGSGRDRLASLLGGSKFSGDRSQWNEAKTGIYCRLAKEELIEFVQSTYEAIKLECNGNATKLSKVKSKCHKAWAITMECLTGPALVLAQQQPLGDAFAVWTALCKRFEQVNLDVIHAIKMDLDRITF